MHQVWPCCGWGQAEQGHGADLVSPIDVSKWFPRKLLTEDVASSDVVVTMGCGDACLIFPGKRYEDWALTDPAGNDPDEVRSIREKIDQRIQTLLASMLSDERTRPRTDLARSIRSRPEVAQGRPPAFDRHGHGLTESAG